MASVSPWWPSKWGKDDQIGATNLVTPAKILDALKLVKAGKLYEMSHLYESSMPMFGQRSFTLRIPGGPTGGPLGANNVIYHDEFVAGEIGQVGTQLDGLGHIGMALRGEDRNEMRFYNGFTAAEVSDANGLKKLGIEHVKPIITPGLLFDLVAVKGRNLNLGEEITVADLEAAMARQRMAADAVKPGDCVFLHTGWGSLWNKDNATFTKGEPGNRDPCRQMVHRQTGRADRRRYLGRRGRAKSGFQFGVPRPSGAYYQEWHPHPRESGHRRTRRGRRVDFLLHHAAAADQRWHRLARTAGRAGVRGNG
jgi:hypothetical protein